MKKIIALTLFKKVVLKDFVLKPRERLWIFLKNGTGDFQNSPPFERSAYIYLTKTKSFECFHYFIFETNFLKNKNLECRLLVQSTKCNTLTQN